MNASLQWESNVLYQQLEPRSRRVEDVSSHLNTRSPDSSSLHWFTFVLIDSHSYLHLHLDPDHLPDPDPSTGYSVPALHQRPYHDPHLHLYPKPDHFPDSDPNPTTGYSVPALHQRPQCKRGAMVCHQCCQRWKCYNWWEIISYTLDCWKDEVLL